MKLGAIESVRQSLYRKIARTVRGKFQELYNTSLCRCHRASLRAIYEFLRLSHTRERIFLELAGAGEGAEFESQEWFQRTSITSIISLANAALTSGTSPYPGSSRQCCFKWEPLWKDHHNFEFNFIPNIICSADYFTSTVNQQMSSRRHSPGLSSSLMHSSVFDTTIHLDHFPELDLKIQLKAPRTHCWRLTRITNPGFSLEGAFYLYQEHADIFYLHCGNQSSVQPGLQYFLDIVGQDIDKIYSAGK